MNIRHGGIATGGPAVLAIDQGTSATKAVLVDASGTIVAQGGAPVGRMTPRPGWVEQSADELWDSVRTAVAICLDGADAEVIAIGLTNQRESLVLWERDSGAALSPVISWQDQRGVPAGERLRTAGHDGLVRSVTGLPLDPMGPATRALWLLDEFDPERRRSKQGKICLGTVDSWLLNCMSGGHLIEAGNASRTQLLDIGARVWSEPLLELFAVPEQALPEVLPSIGPFPPVRGLDPVPDGTPVAAVLGDSHAALFAHAGWRPGVVKATYGTGSSAMAVTDGDSGIDQGVCLTIAWDRGKPTYALEGNIRSSGDTLVRLGGLLGVEPAEVARLAEQSGSEGVHLVPAFNGLGAPWWDPGAVGLISGLSSATRAPHLARAALESIAFQVEDVVAAIERSAGPVELLLADGGASANAVLMQLQADTSGRRVRRSLMSDLSALGVAHLAGNAVGLWPDQQLEDLERPGEDYVPAETQASRRDRLSGWHTAVARSRLTPVEGGERSWQLSS